MKKWAKSFDLDHLCDIAKSRTRMEMRQRLITMGEATRGGVGWSEAAAERGSGGSSNVESGGLRKNGERGLDGRGRGMLGLIGNLCGGFL
jgi:hypothetical protein